jgi:low affinity Fe/Cu permease
MIDWYILLAFAVAILVGKVLTQKEIIKDLQETNDRFIRDTKDHNRYIDELQKENRKYHREIVKLHGDIDSLHAKVTKTAPPTMVTMVSSRKMGKTSLMADPYMILSNSKPSLDDLRDKPKADTSVLDWLEKK